MFAKNLKYLREKSGMEQIELAYQLGRKSSSSVSEWEKGKYTPKIGVLNEIANIFNVDIDDLMNKDLSFRPSNIIEIKHTKSIPVLGAIACGEPILAEQNITDTIAFPTELLPSGNLFFLKADGDSMNPTISDGAYVMVRKQENVENGEVAAILFDDDNEATLKRVKYIGDNIILEADNRDYDPIIVTKESRPRIIGKAVKVLNDL